MNNKVVINGKMYDIITHEEYIRNPTLYDPKSTVIQRGNLLYPIRSEHNQGIGYYVVPNCPMQYFSEPVSQAECDIYNMNNNQIINFQDISGMAEYLKVQSEYKNLERTILTNPDNIFMPVIGDNDEPTMRALKEAILKKQIDLDKYSNRFGANYCNDKRLFKGGKITLSKLKDITENLDMNCTLIIEDKSPDVPNPIGEKIVVNITDYKKE